MASTTIDTPAGGVGKPASAPAMPAEKVSGRTWMAVAAGMLGAFMAVLDIQITNSSLKDILGTLSATQEEGSWIATAYLVAEIIVIPMTGLLTRVFGMRAYLMGTTSLFLVFSTLCGFAWNLPSMIVFRMLQGFTGGALIPMAMTLVMTKLPPSKRAAGMAIFGLTATLAPAMGPTFGGYLSELYGWPSIFYINWVPGVLLIGGIALGLDKEKFQPNLLFNADWLGIAFMAMGLGSLTIFLEEGNSKDWFDSSFIITFAAMAIVGLLGWAVTGAMRKQPFVNLGLYGQRNFFAATALSMAMGMGLYGSSFLLPLYLGQIAGYSPMQIGEVIMWVGLPQLFIMPFVAKLSSKVDNRILCSFGLLLFGGSCLMNAYMDATTGYDQLLLSQVVRALGQPFVMLTLSNFAMNGISPKDMPSASSLINMTRNLGGSIGIALLATALTSREHFHSQRLGESVTGFAAATQERLAALTQSFMSKGFDATSASDMALKAVDGIVRREAYVMAYNDGFFLVAMVLFGCIGVLWFSDKVKAPSGGGGGAH
ncbi:DHA2 family efflux MFS transporter permease subunit [Duganella sp. BJB488]|uniref:DHA2 family efflux MFS transporter permease subunit n=1 Tax=unclassified Duganella TaxID=2636909 RepID=UPI000E345AFE|nr:MULTISPECIES: DHA2 family efflux MFS transporter permease subunit [unclassified Duganella]NVD73574.1 DHA2 family efflux MFS transporter permease subunit [Duganella sp. BJB1802]RFP26014.1 DHA2 family efflux MFS transporter permease subunit [Duganella sp. BJB489]RFP28245.1 DHA2 family efflux MFS transporter permease subunit [Duganella sp. BJB488]RFP36944.1 DHA2 family efflux MFS transporter permease subunit [Duganella sp. BJB480]